VIEATSPTSPKKKKRGFVKLTNLEKTHEYLKKPSKGFSKNINEQRKGKSLKNLQMNETCLGFQSRV
jgi:hypothetical protein